MYDILHLQIKPFCRYCLQIFSTAEILKRPLKKFFRVNGKK